MESKGNILRTSDQQPQVMLLHYSSIFSSVKESPLEMNNCLQTQLTEI